MILCNDLALPEGPLAMPDGSWLVTELALRRGCVSVVSADGGRREIAKTGRPNGLARTADGTIWVAESLTPSIVRLTLDGQMETVLTHVGGVPLLWPNDLCVGPDGVIYFTDSGALVGDFLDGDAPKAGFASVTFDGRVGRFDPRTGEAAFIDTGLVFANGIAFGVDGHLYASETFTGEVYRYRIDYGQVSARRERFGFHETSTDDRRTDTRSRPDDPDRALVQHPVPARRESDLRRRDVAERSEGRDRLDRRDHPQRGDVRGGQPHDLRGVSRRAGQPRSLVGRRRPEGDYDDPTAVLSGTWGRNQHGRCTVFCRNPTQEYFQEVQIRLRSTMSPHSCTGYEVFWRCLKSETGYAEIVRWDGKIGNWTSLQRFTGPQYGVEDGDIVEATIVGNVITGLINGAEVISTTDDTYAEGSPGVGFNFYVGETNVDHGFTSFEVDTWND